MPDALVRAGAGAMSTMLSPSDETVTGWTADGPRLRWWRRGERGPRVLLIMGLGMRGELWSPQVHGLAGTHQVAFFDHRGVGESELGKRRVWSMGDMADDASRVLDAIGWSDAHVVGVSMGGMVAQELVLRAPARARSLTLVATHAGGGLRAKAPTVAGLRHFVRANTSQGHERVRAVQRLLYPDDFLRTVDPAALEARMRAQLSRPIPRATLLGQLSAVMRHDTTRRLHRVAAPTLIVKPGLDVLIRPTSSDRLRALIPHARLLELPEAGHGVIFQAAHPLNEALAHHVGEAELLAIASGGSTVHA